MISLEKIPVSIKNVLRPLIAPKIPRKISERFRDIDQKGMTLIETSLKHNYFTQNDAWFSPAYVSFEKAQNDLQDHLYRRLDNFRKTVIPWLNDVKPLCGSRILEIGCGTGSSTVALAEQGADVTGIDILESSIRVAKDRCKVYDLNVNFLCANATELYKIFAGQHYDLIIFFATLEHMTHDERMIAMKNTWEMLSQGSLWCVIDTPNRLWYFDDHTSLLPFYQWLPDDLAFLYSQFSPRESFCDLYREMNDDSTFEFLRRGRGVSFHEFELTMKRAEALDVVSSLSIYLRSQNLLRKILLTSNQERRFESFLTQVGPKIHRGFYQRSLDLIIRKD
jgi:2-polyprenyl-3-methyl-5-hydroxy-6-metoxy-1,4-benzoquinol methylase